MPFNNDSCRLFFHVFSLRLDLMDLTTSFVWICVIYVRHDSFRISFFLLQLYALLLKCIGHALSRHVRIQNCIACMTACL